MISGYAPVTVEVADRPEASRNPIYNPAALGCLHHLVVQRAAEHSGGFPTLTEARAVVGELVGEAVSAPAHRIALKARLNSLASRYVGTFALPAGTKLLGSEISVAGSRLDLVWLLPSGLLVADELKSGALRGAFDADLVAGQLARQLAGSLAQYGECFLGIRLVRLATPEASQFLSADGQTIPLSEVRFS